MFFKSASPKDLGRVDATGAAQHGRVERVVLEVDGLDAQIVVVVVIASQDDVVALAEIDLGGTNCVEEALPEGTKKPNELWGGSSGEGLDLDEEWMSCGTRK